MIIGSLVLQSNSEPQPLSWFETQGERGQHTPGRAHGTWFQTSADEDGIVVHRNSLYIPQRDKRIQITWQGTTAEMQDMDPIDFAKLIAIVEAKEELLTQRDRLAFMQGLLSGRSRMLVTMNSEGTHGSWSFLAAYQPLYILGIQDQNTTQLLWSTTDLVDRLKHQYPAKFTYYRFPLITDSVLFVNTQAVCSKWWRWRKSFDGNTLRCFNALEAMLFKV